MPYRVSACFEDFIKFKVNLDPERVKIARTSRDNLLDNIKQLCVDGKLNFRSLLMKLYKSF